MGDICGDNRFEIIDKAKEDILKSTNISSSENEMKVLDNFLFRCWQMGWLDRYNGVQLADKNPINVWHGATEKPRTKEWLLVQFDEDDYDTLYFIYLSIDMWCDWCKNFNVIQWAYISDLLPKGGEK